MFTFSFSITLLIIHSSDGISIRFLHWLSWTTQRLKCLFPEVSRALNTRWLVAGGCVVDCCWCRSTSPHPPSSPYQIRMKHTADSISTPLLHDTLRWLSTPIRHDTHGWLSTPVPHDTRQWPPRLSVTGDQLLIQLNCLKSACPRN